MFTYKAMRHYAPVEDRYDTIEEAINRALNDIEMDTAWPLEILDEAGKVIMNNEDLYERWSSLQGSCE